MLVYLIVVRESHGIFLQINDYCCRNNREKKLNMLLRIVHTRLVLCSGRRFEQHLSVFHEDDSLFSQLNFLIQ